MHAAIRKESKVFSRMRKARSAPTKKKDARSTARKCLLRGRSVSWFGFYSKFSGGPGGCGTASCDYQSHVRVASGIPKYEFSINGMNSR